MSVGICIVRLLLHRHHRQPGYRTVKQLASLTLYIDCTTYKLGLARMLGSAAEGDIVEVSGQQGKNRDASSVTVCSAVVPGKFSTRKLRNLASFALCYS